MKKGKEVILKITFIESLTEIQENDFWEAFITFIESHHLTWSGGGSLHHAQGNISRIDGKPLDNDEVKHLLAYWASTQPWVISIHFSAMKQFLQG